MLAPWKKSYDKPRQNIKKQKYHFADKGSHSQSYGFSNSCKQMWELDHKEGWASKNWCFWTAQQEMTLEGPLDSKEIKPVNPKGNQPWIFTGRTDAEAPIIWPPDAKSWLIRKDHDAGKNWRCEEKGQQRWDGWMASLTHRHELEQAPGVGDKQRSLEYCSSWSPPKSRQDLMTQQQQH